ARAALADDHRHIGHAEREAGVDRTRDRLRLAALLGVDARKGPGGVDERDHRQVEPVGEIHQPDRLAVALRARHAEIVPDAALGVVALLLPDDTDRFALQPAAPGDDRIVL